MDVLDFIGKLVNHIHQNGFRAVRRYGLYSRVKNKLSMEIIKLYNFMKQRDINIIIQKQINKSLSFKERLIETFGVNPFKCNTCNNDMILWEVWHYKYGVIYSALDRSNYRNIIDDDIGKIEIEYEESEQLKLF